MSDLDLVELADRYSVICKKYGELALELAAKFEEFGRYRNEIQFIIAEFAKRGTKLDDPESIKEILEKELEKRKTIDGPTTDQR